MRSARPTHYTRTEDTVPALDEHRAATEVSLAVGEHRNDVWMVVASTASFGKRDLGPIGPLAAQPSIGDIPLPQRGVFMVGGVDAEAYAPSSHLPATG